MFPSRTALFTLSALAAVSWAGAGLAQTGSACALQYSRVCPGVSAGGPGLQACLDQQGAALSPACRQAAGVPTVPLDTHPATTLNPPATTVNPPAATATVPVEPSAKPRSAVAPTQLGFLCADDLIKLCPNVVNGTETGALACLRRNIDKVSEPCAFGLGGGTP